MRIHNILFQIDRVATEITNIRIISVDNKQNIIIKYEQNNVLYYHKLKSNSQSLLNILYEFLNKSPLWEISVSEPEQSYYNTNIFYITTFINVNLINEYIYRSNALLNILWDRFNDLSVFEPSIFATKSYITYNPIYKIKPEFKIELYDYQKRNLSKMIDIETRGEFKMDYTVPIIFNQDNIEQVLLYNPILNRYSQHEEYVTVRTSGGIISDAVGMGKTFTTLALIAHNKSNYMNKIYNNKIISNATVIVCPSHLVKQWKDEAKRCMPKAKVLTITTKSTHIPLKFKDFINADIIITSQQFLMNFKYYPTLYYRTCSASSHYSTNREHIIGKELLKLREALLFEELINEPQPVFEFFHFNRLVIDEGHEIFSSMLSNRSLCSYMTQWFINFSSTYKWYVSGTPFVNTNSLTTVGRYINMNIIDEKNDIDIKIQDGLNNPTNLLLNDIINKDYLWEKIFKNICIRHQKDDVKNQVEIPDYKEYIDWIEFTPMERELYNINSQRKSRENLQKLCCHLLMTSSNKKIFEDKGFGDQIMDLTLMQDTLIKYHKQNHDKYEQKISELDCKNPAYYMVKKTYETQMRESKYLYTILTKMKSIDINDEECPICISTLLKPILTKCGHIYCFECIKQCMQKKSECPLCKKVLKETDLMAYDAKEEKQPIQSDQIIQKYGSKLGHIIKIVGNIISDTNNRVIIFSQWDDMLNLVKSTLYENKINSSIVKGSASMRDNAIEEFNKGDKTRVIMLSLKNGASGTNLTRATHVILIDPVDAPKNEIKSIEGQAIGRACRIGQTKMISVIRVLIKDTIEEEIYANY